MLTLDHSKKRLFAVILVAGVVAGGCSKQKQPQSSESVTVDAKDGGTSAAGERKILYWRAPMDPTYVSPEPGKSPMGMDLIPVYEEKQSNASATGEKKVLYWRAPMDPSYISPKPGKSPMGMDLIPVYEGEETFGPTVKINPVVEQNIGVRIRTAERRDVYQKIRTVGRIDYDESRVAQVHTKFSGWIEKTYVNTTGQPVKKGEILLDIYSPQLVTAQEEYLDALENLKNISPSTPPALRRNLEGILASTKRRLEYFDISTSQIETLAKTGQVRKNLSIESPFNGIVVEKNALDGMEVKPGMRLYTIADLSEIWVYADVYEYEVPWLREGQQASMTLSYRPGKTYRGRVQYIYPYLEEKTRTVKVRLAFKNPKLELKPGMYANVDLKTAPLKNVVAVPMEAVLFSGERNLVIVALGGGRFAPRDVTVGVESGDNYYEIREGLKEGEQVVVSAQFLLDSESRLQESIAKMLASKIPASKSFIKSMDTAAPDEEKSMKMPDKKEHQQKPVEDSMPEDSSKMKMKMNMNMGAGQSVFGTVTAGMLTNYICPPDDKKLKIL